MVYELHIINEKDRLELKKEFETEEELYHWLKNARKKRLYGTKEDIHTRIQQKREEFEWRKEGILLNRRKEYPTYDQFLEALVEGKLEEIEDKVIAAIEKHPIQKDKDRKSKAWGKLRKTVKEKLRDTDYTQLADSELDKDQKAAYREYRKYLKKVEKSYNDKTIWGAKVLSFEDWSRRG
jgi:hypothetical protein